jgi:hypothetical protein
VAKSNVTTPCSCLDAASVVPWQFQHANDVCTSALVLSHLSHFQFNRLSGLNHDCGALYQPVINDTTIAAASDRQTRPYE